MLEFERVKLGSVALSLIIDTPTNKQLDTNVMIQALFRKAK